MIRSFWLRVWTIFAGVQAVGLTCWFVQTYSAIVWGTGLILCFPGNLLGAAIAERLLWHSGASLFEIGLAGVPLLLLVNGLVWFLACSVIRLVTSRAARARTVRMH